MKQKIKVMFSVLAAAACFAGHASVWKLACKGATKAGVKIAEKVDVRTGAKGAAKGAAKCVAKGTAKLAAVTAEREATMVTAKQGLTVAKSPSARKILAFGTLTAMAAYGMDEDEEAKSASTAEDCDVSDEEDSPGEPATVEKAAAPEKVPLSASTDGGEHAVGCALVRVDQHPEYAASIRRHYDKFVSEARQVCDMQFSAVRGNIPDVAAKFGSFSRCKDLLVTIVKDNIKGGNETEDALREDLEVDFYRGLYAARDKVHERLVAFVENLEQTRTAFMQKRGGELDAAALPDDETYQATLSAAVGRIGERKDNLASAQNVAAIAVAFEVVYIRDTVAVVTRILGKTALRQAGTMTAGAGMAVADGPSPLLDMAAAVAILGSTAWSVWDVYEATSLLPMELQSTLKSVTDDCERQTIEETRKAAAAIFRAYGGILPAEEPSAIGAED